jgi:hypothetical protein
MGDTGLGPNSVKALNHNKLQKSSKDCAAITGAVSESGNKSKVEIILSMIRELSDAEYQELFQRLLNES